MARAGKFGEIVHCHGAYSHDLRDEIMGGNVNRHYRLNNYMHRNCENYPTHELGPIAKILGINRGNRMISLVSVASKAAGLREFAKTDKNPDKSLENATFRPGRHREYRNHLRERGNDLAQTRHHAAQILFARIHRARNERSLSAGSEYGVS